VGAARTTTSGRGWSAIRFLSPALTRSLTYGLIFLFAAIPGTLFLRRSSGRAATKCAADSGLVSLANSGGADRAETGGSAAHDAPRLRSPADGGQRPNGQIALR